MIHLQYRKPIDEKATLVQLFVRVLGLVWLFVMLDTAWQWTALCGEEGLLPAHAFADRAREMYAQWAFFRFPSLLWVSQSDGYALGLLAFGAIGAIMALTDRLATLGLCICFAVWLSFVNFGGDFFAYIWDTFLLELGFLAIFFSWLRNAGVGRKLALAALWLLNFRLWFSMGMVKLLYNNAEWISMDFMQYFLPNQPMPTPAAWYMAQWPDWVHKAMLVMTLVIEVLLPWCIIWGRTRLIAFVAFVGMSVAIQVSGNFGLFNVLSIVAAIPLLVDTSWGRRIGAWLAKSERWNRYLRLDPNYQRLRDWPRRGGAAILQFQMLLQVTLIVLLFFPVGNRFLNFLNYVPYRQDVVEWEGNSSLKTTLLLPLRAGSNFRIANPYGVFKNIAYRRWELMFEASADTSQGFWHPYAYSFKPGAGNPPQYFAPVFPRFEQQLFYEAQQGSFFRHNTFHHLWGRPFCWTDRLVESMWDGKEVERWFLSDPLHGQAPQALRMQVRELRFSSPEEREATGSHWQYRSVFLLNLPPKGTPPACPILPDSIYVREGKHARPSAQ